MKYNDGSERAYNLEKRFNESMLMLLEKDYYIFTPESPDYTVDYLSELSIANRSGEEYEERRGAKKPMTRIRETNGADIQTLKSAINIFTIANAGTMDNHFNEAMHKHQTIRKIHEVAGGNFRKLINLLKKLMKIYYTKANQNWNVIRYVHLDEFK